MAPAPFPWAPLPWELRAAERRSNSRPALWEIAVMHPSSSSQLSHRGSSYVFSYVLPAVVFGGAEVIKKTEDTVEPH